MLRIQESCETTIEIKKSKFICYLFRIESEEEAKQHILDIKKMHPGAAHHCYAFVLNDQVKRSNDDGEPSGTAGQPMLDILFKEGYDKILGIVVRYFGGIKLGTGGLVRAYTSSLKESLQTVQTYELIRLNSYTLTFPYGLQGSIDYFFSQENIHIEDKQYDLDITYIYYAKESHEETFSRLSNGKNLPVFRREEEVEIPLSMNT